MMFQCEGLRDFGLVLVTSSSPDYEPLFADIQRRADHPLEKRETSAIRISGHTADNWRPIALAIFGPAERRKMMIYRNAILHGSRRHLGERGIAGDNTDVREPEPDEVWKGGCISGGPGGGRCVSTLPIKSVTLILDGVLFLNGEFAGPNRSGLWERVTNEARSVTDVAMIARGGRDCGIGAAEILREIEELTGPPTEHPPAPRQALQRRAHGRSNRTDIRWVMNTLSTGWS
jgi:hypothetical protein